MSFSVKQIQAILQELGVSTENLERGAEHLCSMHKVDLDSVLEQRDEFKKDAEQLPKVQKQLDELKAAAEKGGKDPYKVKYEAIKEEFADYKKGIEAKETAAKKSDAFRALLKEVGIREKRIDAVLRVSDLDAIELDDDGKIVDAGKLKKALAEEWEDFIDSTEQQGAKTVNPPSGKGFGKTMTKDEIMAIRDPIQRQNAIAENIELFGG